MILAAWLPESRWVRRGLQAGAALIVLAMLVAGGWFWNRAQESRGLAALAAATALLPPVGEPLTAEARDRVIRALEVVLSQYPRSSTAPQAAYQLGHLKYVAGQYVEARRAYEIVLSRSASRSAQALAAMGIGYTWEAEKSYANAATAYEVSVKRIGPKSFLYEEALIAQARAQDLAGKSALAIDLYQRVLREVPDGRQAEDLRARVASLRSRSPR